MKLVNEEEKDEKIDYAYLFIGESVPQVITLEELTAKVYSRYYTGRLDILPWDEAPEVMRTMWTNHMQRKVKQGLTIDFLYNQYNPA